MEQMTLDREAVAEALSVKMILLEMRHREELMSINNGIAIARRQKREEEDRATIERLTRQMM